MGLRLQRGDAAGRNDSIWPSGKVTVTRGSPSGSMQKSCSNPRGPVVYWFSDHSSPGGRLFGNGDVLVVNRPAVTEVQRLVTPTTVVGARNLDRYTDHRDREILERDREVADLHVAIDNQRYLLDSGEPTAIGRSEVQAARAICQESWIECAKLFVCDRVVAGGKYQRRARPIDEAERPARKIGVSDCTDNLGRRGQRCIGWRERDRDDRSNAVITIVRSAPVAVPVTATTIRFATVSGFAVRTFSIASFVGVIVFVLRRIPLSRGRSSTTARVWPFRL